MGAILAPCHGKVAPDDTRKNFGNKPVVCVAGLASSALEQKGESLLGNEVWKVTYCSIEELASVVHTGKTLKSLKLEVVDAELNGRMVKSTVPHNGEEQRPVPGMVGLERLNPRESAPPIEVWKGLVDAYQTSFNLHAYNYDWRRWGDPVYVEEMQRMFVDTIEHAVDSAPDLMGTNSQTLVVGDRQKAAVIGHSMGCPIILYMLNKLGPQWVAQYVDSVILVAPATGGSPSMIPSYAHAPFLDTVPLPKQLSNALTDSLGALCATWPCMVAEMPMSVGGINPWPEDFVFAETPYKQYRLGDMGTFLTDLHANHKGRDLGVHLWKGIEEMARFQTCPDVPVSIIYGDGVPTPEAFRYATQDVSQPAKPMKTSPGDGTIVASAAVRIGEAWKRQNKRVNILKCPGVVAHKALIVDDFVLSWFPKLVTNKLYYLEITIISAKNLKDMDWMGGGSSDPYVKVTIEDKPYVEEVDSPTIEENQNPVWNYTFSYYSWEPGDSLFFEVYDEDPGANPDDLMGSATLESQYFEDQPYTAEMDLEDGEGSLTVRVQRKTLESSGNRL